MSGRLSGIYLSEAFQVQYEDVGQRPQTELDAALLKLLAVWTSPRVIRSELEPTSKKIQLSKSNQNVFVSFPSSLGLPVPLWCTAESTGPVSRSEAGGAAPLRDAHFQRLGCIRPQFF